MKKILKTVELSEEVVNYIQRLHYELEGYKSILVTIIRGKKEFSYNKEIFLYYENKYNDINKEYRLAMEELIETHGSEFKGLNNVSTHVDFLSCLLYFQNGNSISGCGTCIV